MFSFFSRDRRGPISPLRTDLHSHLIPGIDDGVKSVDESLLVIDQLLSVGYTRLITTPHLMMDYFGNTFESISAAYNDFLPELRQRGYDLAFECAAEYYLDEATFELVKNNQPLLTFGNRYFLFETNMITEPFHLKEFIFALTSKGYRPVLAHPERYQYMTVEKAEDVRARGVLLQINLLSLTGAYGPQIQKMAMRLIDHKLVDLLGSDCHNLEHALMLEKVQKSKAYEKAMGLPLMNHTL